MASTMTEAWRATLVGILYRGYEVAPRGQKTRELTNHAVHVDLRYPVLLQPERKLQYRFMAAEAHWILSGSNRVDEIAPWNSNIAKFSDDGVTFEGAYGPRIHEQLPWAVARLYDDRETRQAVMTIWQPTPRPSKDIPCTVAVNFQIRRGCLDLTVFMRSSDAWLGLPYDVFNFSLLGHLVLGLYNDLALASRELTSRPLLAPGSLYLLAASSHLYEEHWAAAETCVENLSQHAGHREPPVPDFNNEEHLMATLRSLRDSKKGDPLRWWER